MEVGSPVHIAMWILFAGACCACFFNTIVIISASSSEDVVEDLSWSHGYTSGADLYIGVFSLVTKFGSDSSSAKWKDCSGTVDICDDCEPTMKATIAFAVFSLVATIPGCYTNFMRTLAEGNNAMNKMMGMASALAAVLLGMVCVIVFGAGCQLKIEDETAGVDWEYGPAFALMIVMIVFEAIICVGNFLIPTTAESDTNPGSKTATTRHAPVPVNEEPVKAEVVSVEPKAAAGDNKV